MNGKRKCFHVTQADCWKYFSLQIPFPTVSAEHVKHFSFRAAQEQSPQDRCPLILQAVFLTQMPHLWIIPHTMHHTRTSLWMKEKWRGRKKDEKRTGRGPRRESERYTDKIDQENTPCFLFQLQNRRSRNIADVPAYRNTRTQKVKSCTNKDVSPALTLRLMWKKMTLPAFGLVGALKPLWMKRQRLRLILQQKICSQDAPAQKSQSFCGSACVEAVIMSHHHETDLGYGVRPTQLTDSSPRRDNTRHDFYRRLWKGKIPKGLCKPNN